MMKPNSAKLRVPNLPMLQEDSMLVGEKTFFAGAIAGLDAAREAIGSASEVNNDVRHKAKRS